MDFNRIDKITRKVAASRKISLTGLFGLVFKFQEYLSILMEVLQGLGFLNAQATGRTQGATAEDVLKAINDTPY